MFFLDPQPAGCPCHGPEGDPCHGAAAADGDPRQQPGALRRRREEQEAGGGRGGRARRKETQKVKELAETEKNERK